MAEKASRMRRLSVFPRQRGQQEAGQHGEHAYGGDRLPGHALGDGKISGNGRQQAYGDEFGCNQGHDAHK